MGKEIFDIKPKKIKKGKVIKAENNKIIKIYMKKRGYAVKDVSSERGHVILYLQRMMKLYMEKLKEHRTVIHLF